MKFSIGIDRFISDMKLEGRINSPSTERDYRGTLGKHAEDVGNRDPSKVGREDVKRTLGRWLHPNSAAKNRSIMVSFYDWMVEEGMRESNPARQTRRPRRRPTTPYRMTREEVRALLGAAQNDRERRAIYLGVFAGLRSAELRGLQGRHFARGEFIHVTADIAKGNKERWVPIADQLSPVVDELRADLEADDYALPSQRSRLAGVNRVTTPKRKHPASAKALWELVKRVGERAGISQPIHPHLMRHAFADHVTEHLGGDMQTTSALMGHSNVATTQTYVGKPSPDALRAAMEGFTFGALLGPAGLSIRKHLANPVKAPAGIEPA